MKETPITVFKNIYKSNDVPFHVTLEKIALRVKEGKSKPIIDKIRKAVAKGKDYSEYKKQLPAIIFQGVFTKRNMDSCIQPSGFMILDFDKIPDEEYQSVFDAIADNPHTVLAMRSPSGNGIKAVIHIPETNKDDYKRYFEQFDEEFEFPYFDKQTSDFARACFESYDPDVYVNYDAEVYSPELVDKGFEFKDREPMLVLHDDQSIIDRIMRFNWKKTASDGRNNYVFDLAGAFCEYGVSKTSAESFLINEFQEKDFKESEIRTTIKSAYSTRQPNSKYFEDYQRLNYITYDIEKPRDYVVEKYGLEEEEYDRIKNVSKKNKFYSVKKTKNGPKVTVNPLEFKLFLERSGFRKYYPHGAKNPTLLKVESYMVEETSVNHIKDFVLKHLMEEEEFEVWNYMASTRNIFTETYLNMLSEIDLKILKDDKHRSRIAFKNGILEITKDSVKLGDPIDIDSYIWKSHVIPYDYVEVEDFTNDYSIFIKNISNKSDKPIKSVIGYLCSNYKNKINNKAVILNDEVISDNPEGGTGKGLFIQGIRQVRSVAILDGKSFDDNKSFAYQTVNTDTDVLVFDDVKRNFDFERKFSLVTEGLTLERKNKDAVKLSVEDSPKIVISTNYAIKGEGNSHERRRHEVEVNQHYNKEVTPFAEFGHNLFDDWDEEHYMRFYNYIVDCIQIYLREGLILQEMKNFALRKFREETSNEFHEWIIDHENVERNSAHSKSGKYDELIDEYPDLQRFLTRKRFIMWIRKYCDFAGFGYRDGNTNGIRWFEIVDTDAPIPEVSDDGLDF